MNKEDVKNLASLARISVNENEAEGYLKDFDNILRYVDQIQSVETGDTKPSHFNKNTMRKDDGEIKAGTHTDDLLAEAPKTEKGFYKVKKIL